MKYRLNAKRVLIETYISSININGNKIDHSISVDDLLSESDVLE